MADTIMYTLEGGDILLVPAKAKCLRYTPIAEDEGETISADDLPTKTPRRKQKRHQHHKRTPKKYWHRRKLVAEHGIMDTAHLEGVSPQTVHAQATKYQWKYPKYKRGVLNGVSNGD